MPALVAICATMIATSLSVSFASHAAPAKSPKPSARKLRLRSEAPYHPEVPKDPAGNAAYRMAVIEECQTAKGALEVWMLASRDILWCCDALCWTYDPRLVEKGQELEIPWVLFPEFQEEAILTLQHAIGRHDLCSEKSREEGWTWMMLYSFWHQYMFRPARTFLVVSRNESMVERSGNKGTLFWKLDYLTRRLPCALRPTEDTRLLHRLNLDTESSIEGTATTKNIGRGERYTAVGVDEFAAFDIDMGFKVLASLGSVTNSRLYNSTHQHEGTAFYKVSQNPAIPKITTMWWDDPRKNKGLYTSKAGALVKLDPNYEYPRDAEGNEVSFIVEHPDGSVHVQPLILDGKHRRSPWYDHESEVELHGIEALIASELDCNPSGSSHQYFGNAWNEHKANHASEPVVVGTLRYNAEKSEVEFVEDADGDLALWMRLNAAGRPPRGREYIVGTDVGAGVHESPHVVYDRATREKVAEFVTTDLMPQALADYGVSLCRLFNDAYHIWDATGPPGAIYSARVTALGYPNIFYRYTNEHSEHKKQTDKPGFSFSGGREIKGYILGLYRDALKRNWIINHSARALNECARIIITKTGEIVHSKSIATIDPRGSKDNHADLVIADSLVFRAFQEFQEVEEEYEKPTPPGSITWLREKAGIQDLEEAETERAWGVFA